MQGLRFVVFLLTKPMTSSHIWLTKIFRKTIFKLDVNFNPLNYFKAIQAKLKAEDGTGVYELRNNFYPRVETYQGINSVSHKP